MEPLPASEAATLNKRVIEMLEEAFEENPEVNLLSIIPPSYKFEISQGQPTISDIAKLNQKMLRKMEWRIRSDPESDFFSLFQNFYRKEWDRCTSEPDPATLESNSEQDITTPLATSYKTPSLLERLEDVDKAIIVSPLSDIVTTLLEQTTDSTLPNSKSEESLESELLLEKLKMVFRSSDVLLEMPVAGAVFRCGNGDIVAKVVRGALSDSTEYTSMQYLAQNAPDIPAPLPHGLIHLGPYKVLFMSYIPGNTLEDIWPSMTHEQKIMIQRQLDEVFQRLRQLKQLDGHPLGGVNTEGVKDQHRFEYRSDRTINAGADFDDWKFSLSGFSTKYYTDFLRKFLPPSPVESVFTHGDFRPANILVDLNESGNYSVTGIIDWEESGFYPDYHECTKATNLLQSDITSDWYQYLPPCIAPHTFPVRWLVDRLWDRNILYAH